MLYFLFICSYFRLCTQAFFVNFFVLAFKKISSFLLFFGIAFTLVSFFFICNFVSFSMGQVTEETLKNTMGRGYDYANKKDGEKGDASEQNNNSDEKTAEG